MELLAILTAVAGLAITVIASKWAVANASALAYGTSIPPYFLGITIVALGTDGPEIANSIMASLADQGDLNVGNATGSVFAQITLVLGLLPFAAKGFPIGPWRNALVPMLTAASLLLCVLLFWDGYFSRADALLLIVAWIVTTSLAWRYASPFSESLTEHPSKSKVLHLLLMILSLGLVLAGAAAAVEGLTRMSALLGVPEYIISFFGSSIGTSLPEIVVTLQAIRAGQRDLAMGDILGACLLDSTLAPGIGPLFAPTAIDAALAVRGALLAVAAMVIVTPLLWGRGKHDRWSATVLLLIYISGYFLLLRNGPGEGF